MDDGDCFWHSQDGWRYTRGGVKVGPFDRFIDAVEDYYEPDTHPSPVPGVDSSQGVATLLTD